MTNLLLNAFLVLITLFFGLLAYYPLFLHPEETEVNSSPAQTEDVVVSVSPARFDQLPTPITSQHPEPEHRPAA